MIVLSEKYKKNIEVSIFSFRFYRGTLLNGNKLVESRLYNPTIHFLECT